MGGAGERRVTGDRRHRRGDRRDPPREGRRDREVVAGPLLRDDVVRRFAAAGFSDRDALTLADHFLDAERRGKHGHGLSRVEWLIDLPGLDPSAQPELVEAHPGFERWHGRGAVGYLTLAAICDRIAADPPSPSLVVAAEACFPTGALGYWARRIAAEAGRVALLTATSPPRLAHPDGGPPLAGTNPLAIAVPSDDGEPLVADVSMGKVTHGDVIAGRAAPEDLVPFGGEQAYKAFALAVGLDAAVHATVGERDGALLIVLEPQHFPVAALRERASGVRLPGSS